MPYVPEPDEYASAVHRWWHLSRPSPELVHALESGQLGNPGRVLDLGCGLGSELAFLASQGFTAVGIDLSPVAVRRAALMHPAIRPLRADARALPFADANADLILDRGCFHYLEPADRAAYVEEARRVLRPGGRLFLRACLSTAGAQRHRGSYAARDLCRLALAQRRNGRTVERHAHLAGACGASRAT